MANVTLKTEEEQVSRFTPRVPLPPTSIASSVESRETGTATPVAASPSPAARRYDQATIEKALALALQMQQEHQATLSAEQVVRLGEEINVDQAFVLRALAQIDSATEAAAGSTSRVTAPFVRASAVKVREESEEQSIALRPLPQHGRNMAVLVPLFFAFLAFFIFASPTIGLDHSDNKASLLLMFAGGPLLALAMGRKVGSKRLALLSGFCVGFFFFLSAVAATSPMPRAGFFPMLLLFCSVGAALGLTSAVCQQYGPRVYRRFMLALLRRFPSLAAQDV